MVQWRKKKHDKSGTLDTIMHYFFLFSFFGDFFRKVDAGREIRASSLIIIIIMNSFILIFMTVLCSFDFTTSFHIQGDALNCERARWEHKILWIKVYGSCCIRLPWLLCYCEISFMLLAVCTVLVPFLSGDRRRNCEWNTSRHERIQCFTWIMGPKLLFCSKTSCAILCAWP